MKVLKKAASLFPWSEALYEKISDNYYIYHYLPSKVRLDASSVCQLRCRGCSFQAGEDPELDRGFLTLDNFKRFVRLNPFVRVIELSNWGEIFLNPELVDIMYEAKARGIKLQARNGVNFNTVSDEQMQAMAETGFTQLTVSVDGACQETYAGYRVGGDFDRVIGNIKKLQEIKAKHGSKYPMIYWQFVLMEQNELDVKRAKELAAELGVSIYFKYNWDDSYIPKNVDYLHKETGLTELTRAEYLAAHKRPYLDMICRSFFNSPQINWDGRLIGCCRIMSAPFGINMFETGLKEALRSEAYIRAKKCILTLRPEAKDYASCICFSCSQRLQREAFGNVLEI